MRIEDIRKNFPDIELQRAITGGLIDNPETLDVSENKFAENLFVAPNREAVAELFFKTIADAYKAQQESWQKRLLFEKVPPVVQAKAHALSERVMQACLAHWQPYAADINKQLACRGTTPLYKEVAPQVSNFPEGFEFAAFPAEKCRLLDLRAKGEYLRANGYEKARQLIDDINLRDKEDPAHYGQTCKVAMQFQNSAPQPFDKNYLGKGNDLFYNASYAQFPEQSLILSTLPITINDVGNYFEAALSHKTKVFVSLHEPDELPRGVRQLEFWKNETLSQVVLRSGGTIRNVGDPILLYHGKQGRKRPSMLVESKVELSDGRKVVHLHYDGWKDGSEMPDEDLVQKLIDRMQLLSPERKIPVAINCKGGVGRTGTMALCYLIQRIIQTRLEQGVALEQITINIPELLYALRGERAGLISHPEQFVQAYSVTANFVERLLTK